MPKTKSINDIDRQMDRILRLSGEYNRSARSAQEAKVEKAKSIAERYVRNIMNTKRATNDLIRSNNARFSGRPDSAEESYQLWQKRRDRQYSQRTYMGLNAG